jgi:hypothetical protein
MNFSYISCEWENAQKILTDDFCVQHPHGIAHQLATIPHVNMHVTAEQDVSGQSDEKV